MLRKKLSDFMCKSDNGYWINLVWNALMNIYDLILLNGLKHPLLSTLLLICSLVFFSRALVLLSIAIITSVVVKAYRQDVFRIKCKEVRITGTKTIVKHTYSKPTHNYTFDVNNEELIIDAMSRYITKAKVTTFSNEDYVIVTLFNKDGNVEYTKTCKYKSKLKYDDILSIKEDSKEI